MKVWTLEEAAQRVRDWQAAGQSVVTSNGCFDLLHVGHLRTLRTARAQGDVLVVLLNSDESVRMLGKGASRPLVREEERAELLAGLECVDGVVIFAEKTPLEVLARLRPDVHVKGGDYRVEDLPETAVVESWGGRVTVTPLVPGKSTTALERLLKSGDGSRE